MPKKEIPSRTQNSPEQAVADLKNRSLNFALRDEEVVVDVKNIPRSEVQFVRMALMRLDPGVGASFIHDVTNNELVMHNKNVGPRLARTLQSHGIEVDGLGKSEGITFL